MRTPATLAILATCVAVFSFGQSLPEPELGDRLINLPTHLTVGASTIGVVFTHRFSETVSDAGGHDLFGFDSAADVGIGVQIGLGRALQAELYRSSFLKEYETAVKWTLARQGAGLPLGLAVRVGANYRAATGLDDRWSGFAQVIAARRVGDALDILLVPMFASDTPTLKDAFNVAAGAVLHLQRGWDVSAEVVAENHDAAGGTMAWSVALNKRIRGHAFLLYFGNSRATTTDLLVGSDLPGGFGRRDVRLGFNLVRRFPE